MSKSGGVNMNKMRSDEDIDNTEEIKLREMQCELNMLSRPDGSSIFSQGSTVTLAAVYGPVEGKMASYDIFKAYVEVSFSTKSGLPTVRERLRETIIQQCCQSALVLTLHPRAAITIAVQEMQDAGGLLACSINACCAALLNSGLMMRFLFAAVSCSVTKDGEVIVDPSHKDLMDEPLPQVTFVFDSVDGNTISCYTEGTISANKYKECRFKCEKASQSIFKYYRDIVNKYAKTI